jgi:hypothetical protein
MNFLGTDTSFHTFGVHAKAPTQHQEISHEIFAFHAGNCRCDSGDRHAGGGAKLSVVRRLRRLRQPELWVHNISTVLGCPEWERRLLQRKYAKRFLSRARVASPQALVIDRWGAP